MADVSKVFGSMEDASERALTNWNLDIIGADQLHHLLAFSSHDGRVMDDL